MARLIGNVDATGSLSTSVPAPVSDTSSVKLYMPFDVDVQDDSASAHSFTASGGAAVSTTQSKFGSKSLYLDGDAKLETSASSDFTFGTNNFTFEGFMYCTTYGELISCFNGSHPYTGFTLSTNFNNTGKLELFMSDGSGYQTTTSTETYPQNEWVHFACVRAGAEILFFKNGALNGTVALTRSPQNSNNVLRIGASNNGTGNRFFAGYLDDLRITNGVALYTSSFVPPSQAVGASLSGTNETNSTTGLTSIYLPFDVDLDDDSPNSHSVSANGNAAISATQAKFGGKSLALDGSGDSLSLSHTSTLQMDSLDFTIEAWVYISAHKSFNYIFSYSYPLQLVVDSNGNLEIYVNDTDNSTSYLSVIGSTALSTGTWHHIAAIRSGSSLQLFVDGAADGSTSISFNLATPTAFTPRIGDWGDGGYSFNGYIDDLRILKGFAKYTASFTPPTSAVTATVSQTRNDLAVLYLPFDDGLEDEARNHSVTANGNAAISATQAKFGGKSLALDGSGDYLTIPHSGDFEFGDDVFTIEFWMRASATNGDRIIYNKRANNGTYGSIYIAVKDGDIVAGATSNGSAWNLISVNTAFGSVSTNTWYHVAVVREADKKFKGYLDGVATTLSTNTAAIAANTTDVHIGGDTNTNYFSGYLDDFMISKFAKTFSAAPTAASNGEVFGTTTDSRTFSSVWNLNSAVVAENFKAGNWPTVPIPIAWDTTNVGSSVVISNSNLTATISSSNSGWDETAAISLGGHASGKIYFEATISGTTGSGYFRLGVVQNKGSATLTEIQTIYAENWDSNAPAYANKSENRSLYNGGEVFDGSDEPADGDVFMWALDIDNARAYFGLNGSFDLSFDPVNGTGGYDISGLPGYNATDPWHIFFQNLVSTSAPTLRTASEAQYLPSGYTYWGT